MLDDTILVVDSGASGMFQLLAKDERDKLRSLFLFFIGPLHWISQVSGE